jgi:hypothetical protein
VRAKYAPIVKSGKAMCARCDRPILPAEAWDLDHDDDDPLQRKYLGASHARCNRASVTHLKEAATLAAPRSSRQW